MFERDKEGPVPLSENYTFPLRRSRVLLRWIGMAAVMVLLLADFLWRGSSWFPSATLDTVAAGATVVILVAGYFLVRAQRAALSTELTEDGVGQRVGDRERFVAWDDVTEGVLAGHWQAPQFEVRVEGGGSLFVDGRVYEKPNRVWAAFKRHVDVVDRTT